ncbi:MAG TPA: CHASE4 domain-containing protein, partial [Steroidobacteraceae bacterium]|nr:CHASE4 domain-containing protein [Steroidobacteraceae bacterium]
MQSRQPGTPPAVAAAVIGLAVLLATAMLVARILVGSFARIETDEMRQKAMQLVQALDADLRQLDVSNRDYADWDDAVAFLHTRDPLFVAANFTRETLKGMHVDVVLIADGQGLDVYSGYYDRARDIVVSPAPGLDLEPLRRFIGVGRLDALSAAQRILRTPSGLISVAAREIRHTDGTGPSGATLLFARFIADAELQRIQQTSQMPLRMSYVDRPDFQHLPAPVRSWALSGAGAESFMAWPLDRKQIAAYALLRGVDAAPLAVLSTVAPREVFALGFRTTAYLLGVILALASFCGGLAIWFVVRLRRSFARQHATEARYRLIG